jgi:transcription antitermination factor NusG
MIAHQTSTEMIMPAAAELVPPGLPASRVADQKEPHWFAAYTCANHEKRAAEHLYARDLEHFLPLYTSQRKWKDRRVQLEMPLFPGYIFVRIEPAARLRVLEIPSVVRLVGFNGQPYPLPDSEIESLRAAVLQGSRIEPHPYLTVGSSVRIKGGPLAGVQGKLIRRKNTYRVVLSLDLIARSAVVEVDAADVERI